MMSIFRNTAESTLSIDWSKQLTGLETFLRFDRIIYNSIQQGKTNQDK